MIEDNDEVDLMLRECFNHCSFLKAKVSVRVCECVSEREKEREKEREREF